MGSNYNQIASRIAANHKAAEQLKTMSTSRLYKQKTNAEILDQSLYSEYLGDEYEEVYAAPAQSDRMNQTLTFIPNIEK